MYNPNERMRVVWKCVLFFSSFLSFVKDIVMYFLHRVYHYPLLFNTIPLFHVKTFIRTPDKALGFQWISY